MPIRVEVSRFPIAARRLRRQRGTAMVEFALCFSMFWLPLFFGLAVFGFSLVRSIQVTHLCRDAGHMYAFGTDFSQTASQNLLGSIAVGMDTSSTGNTKVILSTVTYIDAADCTQGGLTANAASCPNYKQYVFTRQVTVPLTGGTDFTSAFGSPASVPNATTGISQVDQLKNTSARVTNFPSISGITLVSGQLTYVSEVRSQALNPISWSSYSNPGATARSYF